MTVPNKDLKLVVVVLWERVSCGETAYGVVRARDLDRGGYQVLKKRTEGEANVRNVESVGVVWRTKGR